MAEKQYTREFQRRTSTRLWAHRDHEPRGAGHSTQMAEEFAQTVAARWDMPGEWRLVVWDTPGVGLPPVAIVERLNDR